MWSIGVTAFKLLSGYYPFYGELEADTERNIKKAKFNFKASSVW
jgi:serine/threonine protein kinase